jgi:hypothetical protein
MREYRSAGTHHEMFQEPMHAHEDEKAWERFLAPPDCVKILSEPFDQAQGERISTQSQTRPHRSW